MFHYSINAGNEFRLLSAGRAERRRNNKYRVRGSCCQICNSSKEKLLFQFLPLFLERFYEVNLDRRECKTCPLPELVVFDIRLLFSHFGRDSPGVEQQFLAREFQEVI